MNNKSNEDNGFLYIPFKKDNYPIDIITYMDILLIDTESKHVTSKNDETSIFFELSEKVGYNNTILGIHRTSIIENEYFRIKNMSNSSCLRAVRFVITKDGRIWSDNTHWTLAYIYKYGIRAKISDIPFYITDFRSNLPTLYDCEGVVFDSISDIQKAIIAAKTIQARLDLGWRPINISYSINQLYLDLEKIVKVKESHKE